MAADAKGNVFVSGFLWPGEYDFGGQSEKLEAVTGFLAKFDRDGQLQWVRTGKEYGGEVVVDPQDDAYFMIYRAGTGLGYPGKTDG